VSGTTNILVVDDEVAMRLGLKEVLAKEGYKVELAQDGEEACARIDKGGLDAVVTDLRMPKRDGLEVLRHAKQKAPDLLVFVISAYGDVPTAVEAMKNGAADFIMKPFNIQDVRTRVRTQLLKRPPREDGKKDDKTPRVESRKPLPAASREEVAAVKKDFPEVVGESPLLVPILKMVKKIAPTDSTVLITGETGTGKEVIARALHRLSKRASGPFIATTLGSVPATLIESELFGHAKGAFTGAVKDRDGLFESANKGTLFLDEVGDVDLPLQPKLLRAIQEREVVRIGEAKTRKVDVRLVAATWQDLQGLVKARRYREDLYFRLNVVNVPLPPLRERLDDLPLLLDHFLQAEGKKIGRNVRATPAAIDRLREHRWPGNIRELFHVAQKLAILASSDDLTADDAQSAIAP
jgi:DNA-binding NtrC family response regulator